MSVLSFTSKKAYESVMFNATHRIVASEHVFVKQEGEDIYLAVKGPLSGRFVTERALERLKDANI